MKTSTSRQFKINLYVKKLSLFISLLVIGVSGFSQSITLPGADGAVFQRKGVGQGAELEIGINFNDAGLSNVQVYVEKYNDNSSSTTLYKNWENYTCDAYPNVGGNYKRVILNLPDGMFKVKVRRSDNQSETAFRRLGVGEVFYVAGQSNTTGREIVSVPATPNPSLVDWVQFENSKNASVVYLNSSKVQASCPSNPNYGLSFKAGFDGSDPTAGYVSHWYRLAERLVFTLKVPVAIHQAGWSGSSVKDWSDASNDTKVCRFYQNSVSSIETYPYYNLRTLFTDRKFNGVRAVLWHQGEYDAAGMSKSDYKNYLSNLIQKSRTHSQSAMGVSINLPWVIAQASKSSGVLPNSNITTAQSEVAQQSYNWLGPNTDNIDDRIDGTHFNQAGLSTLSDSWYDKLVGGIISSSIPIPAFGRVGAIAGCNPSAPACGCGFDLLSVSISGQSGSFGFHACDAYAIDWKMKNSSGNVVASGNVAPSSANVPFSIPSGIPTGTYTFETCVTKNTPTGSTTCNGFDSMSFVYTNGCISPTPTISANGSTSLCGGGLVSLSASGCNGGVIYWSNGGTGTGTTISAAGNYTATCTLPGCAQSGVSNSVTVTTCNPISQCYRFYVANWYANSPSEKRAITLTNTSNGPVLNLIWNDISNGSIWKQVADGAHTRLVSVTNENMNITIDGGTAYLGVTVNVAAYNGSDSQKWAIEAAPAPNQNYFYIKHKLNSGLFIGGATGAYNGGDGNNDTKDLRLDNDTAWGYNKWFRELATCPNGRISAEYAESNVDEGSTKTVVSPNPTDGIVKVKYHLAGQATVFFSLTDNLGKTILTKQIESKAGANQTEFDLKNNPAGIYYLNLRSVQKTETVKVVKVN